MEAVLDAIAGAVAAGDFRERGAGGAVVRRAAGAAVVGERGVDGAIDLDVGEGDAVGAEAVDDVGGEAGGEAEGG